MPWNLFYPKAKTVTPGQIAYISKYAVFYPVCLPWNALCTRLEHISNHSIQTACASWFFGGDAWPLPPM